MPFYDVCITEFVLTMFQSIDHAIIAETIWLSLAFGGNRCATLS